MFDQKQKSCIKCIHLVTDDGLCNRKGFYKVKIVFIHPPRTCAYEIDEYLKKYAYTKSLINDLVIRCVEIIDKVTKSYNDVSKCVNQFY